MKTILQRKSLSGNQFDAGSDTHPFTARAFTLIELLVVVCVLAVLAATLAPTLAGSRIGSQTLRCVNNNRQLAVAWRMYADDSSDRIVYAGVSGATMINSNDVYAWTGSSMDFNPGNTGNWDTNVDIVKRPLWPYTSKDASIYRCPSDHSYVVVDGVAKPRVRSFAMNLFTGGFAPAPGSGPAGTDGGLAPKFRIFSKTTELTAPGPAKTFVFIDMRTEEVNYGDFATDMAGYPINIPINTSVYAFYDFPGIFHNFGASVSFADGRAEIRRWVDPRTGPPISGLAFDSPPFASPRNVDVGWLQARATSPK
jgi:prepilin-type N-terminal cleavage/methylation domain-containing protein/prepilin-type processing-associated H-X9-DG protein